MEPSVFIAIIGLLATPIAVGITFLLNRKKYTSDISVSAATKEKVQAETMQIIIDELKEYISELEVKLDLANKKIDLLLEENIKLHEKMSGIMRENIRLQADIELLKRQAPSPG